MNKKELVRNKRSIINILPHFILKIGLLLFLLISSFENAFSQSKSSNDVFVDQNGVMRWSKSKAEVYGFGVNYTTPFAHAYRIAKQLNIPHEKAIDEDVYHFARLGLDAYRIHIWDCEISDTLGNLLNNEHLRLLDYTLNSMKSRGMKFILTPLAYWQNGYPEPNENTPGFSTRYGKESCLTNPEVMKAEENYLFQLLSHVNPYTGIAYKNDPDIVAFEVSNEPHDFGKPEDVTAFINKMVKSMRNTGCQKPIFYNISHSLQLQEAYLNSDIQGGTFQWYPSGLGAGHEQPGNMLANVDKYVIPFADNKKFKKMAKVIYEFDPADVGRSYIYPAMARSFREAGFQWATQFAYDPTFMAFANTEYNTHYMNLAYAPQKALSLKIASEVFHKVPMNKKFGSYPQNTSFDVFNVSYEKDLSEMVSETKFIYTNNTTSAPPSLSKLEQIAGYGNSPVISYEGKGAYFLDKLEKGVWRLEVMPDAVWVSDPFGKTSLKKEVSVINWRKWPITIDLPDLSDNFSIKGLNDGNSLLAQADAKTFTVSPGTYLLVKKGLDLKWKGDSRWNNIVLKEFVAPATTLKKTYVLHQPAIEASAGSPFKIEATIVSPEEPETVELIMFDEGFWPKPMKMERTSGYNYSAEIPADFTKKGFLKYYILVKQDGKYHTYPNGVEGHLWDWDFYEKKPYELRIVSPNSSIFLFNAFKDVDKLTWTGSRALVPGNEPGKAELLVNISKLSYIDPQDRPGIVQYSNSFRCNIEQNLKNRSANPSQMKKIIFRGKSLNQKNYSLKLALLMKDGSAYGGEVALNTEMQDYQLSLSDLKKVKYVILPRPYPSFLPYYFESTSTKGLNLNEVESLQFSLGSDIFEYDFENKDGIAVESVRLE